MFIALFVNNYILLINNRLFMATFLHSKNVQQSWKGLNRILSEKMFIEVKGSGSKHV